MLTQAIDPKTLRYAVYARRSSEDKKKQVQSIPDQLAWAEETSKHHNLTVIGKPITDTKTGTKPGREGFSQLMELIEQGKVDGILTWKIDRLARNPIDEGFLKYALIQGKLKHILACDRQFFEGDNQILMGVEFGAATEYSLNLSRNVRRGQKSKVEKGWLPALAPLGYANDPHGIKGNRKIYKDPERWDLVREAWRKLLDDRWPCAKILHWLNEEQGFRTRAKQKLRLSSLCRVFTNTFYAGIYDWGEDKAIPGKHEPMITLEEYDRAQFFLGRKGKPRPQKHQFAYTGFIRCGECGCMVTASPPIQKLRNDGSLASYQYYHCTKKNKVKRCTQPCIRVENLEQQILDTLANTEMPEPMLRWVFRKLRKKQETDRRKLARERGEISRALHETETMMESLARKLAKEVIDDETYRVTRANFERDRTKLRQRLEQYDLAKDDWLDRAEKNINFARHAKERFENGTPEMRREILSSARFKI